MSEIDWSKAPEGCTHYLAESSTDYECWLKKDGDKWFYKKKSSENWMNARIDEDSWRTITERPSPAWSGEGLPPVGTVCQWFSPIYGWLGGKVVGHDGTLTVIAHNDGYTGCHPHEVRPIRTPEQIAADEREAAVAEMLELDPYLPNTTLGMMSRADFCRTLYEKGYRKP